jgi:hypothetical protein
MTAPVLRSIAFTTPTGTSGPEAILSTLVSLPVTMRDGERWTAFDLGGISLALTSPEELPSGAKASLNIKVDDVDAAYQDLLAAGADSAAAPATGAHEERASVWLSEGIVLSVYRGLPRS